MGNGEPIWGIAITLKFWKVRVSLVVLFCKGRERVSYMEHYIESKGTMTILVIFKWVNICKAGQNLVHSEGYKRACYIKCIKIQKKEVPQ